MITRKKRSPLRMNFNKKNPYQFALLNCLRKCLFTDNEFNLTLCSKFSINEKEYQLWGKIVQDQKFATLEKTKNERYRCQLKEETMAILVRSLSKIQIQGE